MKISGGIKDKAILFGWVAGLLFIISLLWIVTQPAQSNFLMRTVNNVFISNNDPRRLSGVVQQNSIHTHRQDLNLLGYWYYMNASEDQMFVFTVFQGGIMIPLGAIVSPDGKVSEIIPLSAHAVQIFNSLPESILRIYTARIEGNRQ